MLRIRSLCPAAAARNRLSREAKTRAQKRAAGTNKAGLFDIVSRGARCASSSWGAHMRDRAANANVRTRVSKDEAGALARGGEPTCTCAQVRSIVLGLLFTMKIPTQSCEPPTAAWRITA